VTTSPAITFNNGRYRVLGVIHRGPHAIIYEAFDDEQGERLALKVLGPNLAKLQKMANYGCEAAKSHQAATSKMKCNSPRNSL
jgi:hypothetical protein